LSAEATDGSKKEELDDHENYPGGWIKVLCGKRSCLPNSRGGKGNHSKVIVAKGESLKEA